MIDEGPCSPFKIRRRYPLFGKDHTEVYRHKLTGWEWIASFASEYDARAYINAIKEEKP